MTGPDFDDDVVETMREHELIALDGRGSRCSCGQSVPSWLEHLADVATVILGGIQTTRGSRRTAPAGDDAAARRAIAQARQVLAELQAWQERVAEASRLHFDLRGEAWPTIAEWHEQVPRYLDPPAAERWLRDQRVQAGWSPRESAAPLPRHLAIAQAFSLSKVDDLADRRSTRKDLAS